MNTSTNPAAAAIDLDSDGVIPNVAPDDGASFNQWFTLFGQFFDHGLDLVNKGGSGTVFIPLQPDDPLYDPGPDGIAGTADEVDQLHGADRATNQPGPDGILGTADDIHEHTNQTTPFVDQNQTYTSHPSHQVFLREYAIGADGARACHRKACLMARRAASPPGPTSRRMRGLLGIELTDEDVTQPAADRDRLVRQLHSTAGQWLGPARIAGPDGIAGTADDALVAATATPPSAPAAPSAPATPSSTTSRTLPARADSAGVMRTTDADDVAGQDDLGQHLRRRTA